VLPSLGCKRSLLVAAACSLAAAALISAAPAGAVVAEIHGHGFGITPIANPSGEQLASRLTSRYSAVHSSARGFDEPPFGGSELKYHGGPVMHSVGAHVIFWDPGKEFTTKTKEVVEGFFTDVAKDSGLATNVHGVAGQYTDTTGHAAYNDKFEGAVVDETAYPASGCSVPAEGDKGPPYTKCLEDSQLQTELSKVVTEKSLPKGPAQLYFVLLPHTVATCLPEFVGPKHVCSNNFFCAYHSFIEAGSSNEIIYADVPFTLLDTENAKGCQTDGPVGSALIKTIENPNKDTAGTDASTRFADVAVKYANHEWNEAVTDPLVGPQTAWVDEEGQESADKCNSYPFVAELEGEPGFDKHAFAPTLGGSTGEANLFDQLINGGHFYLQSEWDNGAKACTMRPVEIAGAFGPTTGVPGVPITFSASGDPYGGFEPTWTFGDGGTGTGASVGHTYAAAGSYTVTMTPKDNLTGASGPPVAHTVTVTAPAPPPPTITVPPPPPPVPNNTVATTARVNAKTGVLTFTASVQNPGTLSWLATFANGKFGAFSSASRCRSGQIRLAGKCRPAKITFAKGSKSVAGAGTITLTLKPSSSAMKALKNALKHKKGVPVTVTFTFQSSLGGSPSTHSQTITVKLKK
jgi:hypothetical protein